MVFQKKLYYGFNGYQVPPMPRGSRSARVKRSFRKKDRENPMCAFEMLAMVAGNLLLEKETPKPSGSMPSCSKDLKNTIKQETWEEEKQPKLEPCDQGSCDESTLASENFQARNFKCKSKECARISNSVIRYHHPASVALKSEMHTKACDELKCAPSKQNEDETRMTPKTKTCCAQTYSPGTAESHATRATMVEDRTADPLQMCDQNQTNVMGGTDVNLFCMEDPMILDSKLPSLDSSDSSVETPLTGTYFSSNQISSKCYDRVNNVDRYDDENSSRCNIPSTIFSKDFSFHCSEDRRIRKLLASKFWKVGPSLFRDGKSSNNDAQAKSIFRSRRMCYTRQRSQRSSFKRKKILQRDPGLTTNGSSGNGSRFKDSKKEEFLTAATFSEAQKPQFKPEDSQVKFSLKSLKVPELLIEMPETATVGTLKRAVLDTVTAIFQDGTKVGVIYQGKKVKDDNKTLLQAGLPNGIKTDSLSFSLEPVSLRPQPRQTESEGSHLLQQYENESSERLPAADCGVPSSTHDLKNIHRECTESSNCCADKPMVPEDSATCTALADIDNSRALVPVHAMNVEALAAVPFQKKSKRSEHVQRRIRRPFSVVEVEALVQAVEVLGTGRWRDVKHRAFEDAKHRTYVDLKDKWKTLVHTARISPQQRRGEPVPQGLLDRVLVAHAYWSHQQPKLQGKQQQQKQQQEVEQNLLC